MGSAHPTYSLCDDYVAVGLVAQVDHRDVKRYGFRDPRILPNPLDKRRDSEKIPIALTLHSLDLLQQNRDTSYWGILNQSHDHDASHGLTAHALRHGVDLFQF